MEWDLLAPRQTNLRVNWTDISPELADRNQRLTGYETSRGVFTEVIVAQTRPVRYQQNFTELGLDTPPVFHSASDTEEENSPWSGWGYQCWLGWTTYPTGNNGSSSGGSSGGQGDPSRISGSNDSRRRLGSSKRTS